jgi:dTDP-4-dehydrorhamnose 3,5-epimerase
MSTENINVSSERDKFIHNKPQLIIGGKYIDERGKLSFVNDFNLTRVKRFYAITHFDRSVIRAWQGHQQETKWFKCLKGRFAVAWKKIDNWDKPSEFPEAEFEILVADENKVLMIPPGYANGLKALDSDSEIMVFSDYYLGESLDDKIRFAPELWLDWENIK